MINQMSDQLNLDEDIENMLNKIKKNLELAWKELCKESKYYNDKWLRFFHNWLNLSKIIEKIYLDEKNRKNVSDKIKSYVDYSNEQLQAFYIRKRVIDGEKTITIPKFSDNYYLDKILDGYENIVIYAII